jgi:hypothetical protein
VDLSLNGPPASSASGLVLAEAGSYQAVGGSVNQSIHQSYHVDSLHWFGGAGSGVSLGGGAAEGCSSMVFVDGDSAS